MNSSSDATGLSRRQLLRRGMVASLALSAAGPLLSTAHATTKPPKAPDLPPGFKDTFTSRLIDAGGLRQHAVIGGEGPPLLLVHGWPQTWYAWRLLMPALARDYQVIAVDQRGIGLTDSPENGYDSATLANDLVALMEALGHKRFAVVGHDTGFIISYALAADHPRRVARVALAEIPGPPLPGPIPPLFVPDFLNNRLWHIPFNRVVDVPEQLVRGREDIFFGYEFAIQTGDGTKLPEAVVDYYVRLLSSATPCAAPSGCTAPSEATLKQNHVGARPARYHACPCDRRGGELG